MEHVRTYQGASGGVFRPRMLSTLHITFLIALILPHPLQASPGDCEMLRMLGPSFGRAGTVITDFGGGESTAFALALQPDGKILVASTSSVYGSGTGANFALARYKPDGSLDATFGTGGKVISHSASYDSLAAVALQPDGKIVVAGWSAAGYYNSGNCTLARYNADGSLDAGFGSGGEVTPPPSAVGRTGPAPSPSMASAGSWWRGLPVVRRLLLVTSPWRATCREWGHSPPSPRPTLAKRKWRQADCGAQ